MIVICKRETKRLIKGVRYEVQNLWNGGNNQRWIEGKVEIKGIGRFVVSNFTDINGKELPKINIISKNNDRLPERIKFEDIKKGDLLICISDSYKTMIKGGMYKVEEKISEKTEYNWSNNYLKFKGIKRKLKFSTWNFRKLTKEEIREISLNSVLKGENPNIIETTDLRKIDMVENKDLELMKNLCLSILDRNRHHLSILDWACSKNLMGIESKDYEPLLKLTLQEILNKIK